MVTRLNGLATDIVTATSSVGRDDQPSLPAPVLLAQAARGFAAGGVVSDLLDRYALPRRDAFAICAEHCARTLAILREVLGPAVMRRYSAGASDPDLIELADIVEDELRDSTPEDIEPIASAMITLGAALHTATAPLAADPDLPCEIRGAVRIAADTAQTLRTHYGGDSGGW